MASIRGLQSPGNSGADACREVCKIQRVRSPRGQYSGHGQEARTAEADDLDKIAGESRSAWHYRLLGMRAQESVALALEGLRDADRAG
jgi:hypothetical protein